MLSYGAILAYLGMVMILSAFVLETRGRLQSKQTPYLLLMAIGSFLLAVRAALIEEWAFLILEVVWCLAALMTLIGNR